MRECDVPEVQLKECVEKIDWGVDWETLKVKWNQYKNY